MDPEEAEVPEEAVAEDVSDTSEETSTATEAADPNRPGRLPDRRRIAHDPHRLRPPS